MTQKRRRRHTPEQIARKLRDADAMLCAGKDPAAVLQTLHVSASTPERWRRQYGGMKSEEAVRLMVKRMLQLARRRPRIGTTHASQGRPD